MQKPKPGKKSRVVDKWKKKQWLTLLAPSEFDRTVLGETPAEKPKNAVGRTIKVDLGRLSGQRQKRHISMIFKIEKVEGLNASCITVGHKTSGGFLNRLVRRRMSKIEAVQRVSGSDGKKFKVKTIALSVRKLSEKQEKGIRKRLEEEIRKSAQKRTFEQFSQESIFGGLSSKIFKILSKIAPIKRVEVIETRLIEGK